MLIPLTKWLGIAVLLAAVLLMCSYNQSLKGKLTVSSLLLLLLCGASSGIADFSQKLFVHQLPGISASVFNFYTYVFAGIAMVAAYFLFCPKDGAPKTENLSKIFGYIAIMALPHKILLADCARKFDCLLRAIHESPLR